MNLTLIVDRLVAQVSALGGRVDGAAELQVAIDDPERVTKPHAFVIWTGDSPLDKSPVPGQQARFQEDFIVVAAVDNTADSIGEDGVSEVEALAAAIKTALVGWAPSSDHLPIEYQGSDYSGMSRVMLLHSFLFSSVIPGGSIFTYNIEFRVALLAGVSVASVYTLYAGKVDAVIGSSTRLTSDYLLDREVIPEGATRYQLIEPPAFSDERSRVDAPQTELAIRLSVHHHLAPGASERTYTETTMVGHLGTLLPASYWRDSTKISDVMEEPSLGLGIDLARE
jgi:hypothetical protein